VGGLVHHHDLLVFIRSEHMHLAGHHDVAMFGGVAGLEDALAGRKSSDLDLRRQNTRFIVVQKLEKRNVP
jgi:hypothetical protein